MRIRKKRAATSVQNVYLSGVVLQESSEESDGGNEGPRSVTGSYRTYARWEQRIVPGLRSSQYAYCEALAEELGPGRRWLDAGCGHQILPGWMMEQERRLLALGARPGGIALDRPALLRHEGLAGKVLGDLERLPFADGAFDLVSANMVVEHLAEPVQWLSEVKRVLAAEGTIVLHTPNRRHWALVGARLLPDSLKKWLALKLEARSGEDVFRTYYRLNTRRAITELATAAGLQVQSVRLVSGNAALGALGVLAIPELLWIRLLGFETLAALRSNLLVVLRKPAA